MSIILWEVPNFKIDQKTTISIIEGTKQKEVDFDGDGSNIGRMPLLFKECGSAISVANNWLVHMKANLHKKEVNTHAQGLLHFFSFLKDLNIEWDHMPNSIRNRPTYAFKKHLKDSYRSGSLARSTANSYMRVVVNFYKFYLTRNYLFENPPFQFELIKIKSSSSHEFMQNSYIHIDTTDLRLNLPKDTSFYGLSRKLIPFNDKEWNIVDKCYRLEGKGISNTTDGDKLVSLSIEFKLAVALSRYSGLRREELITLRSNSIYKPGPEQLTQKYLIHSAGILLDPKLGIKTKNSTIRIVEIPSSLMLNLHEYINSHRYIKRRKLFESRNPQEVDNPPLLITQQGAYYSLKTLDARWGELRNAVKKEYNTFNHKFHNLRSTYATYRLKELLDTGLSEAAALDYLQSVMGHKQRSTLFGYLKFCKQDLSANQVYENSIDLLLKG